MVQHEDDDYSQMAYKTIKTIHDKGYIEGEVILEYESDYPSTASEVPLDDISLKDKVSYGACTFRNIKITPKGRKALETDEHILEIKHSLKKAKESVEKGGEKVVEGGKKIIVPVVSAAIIELAKKLI